jgi:hypothetical protein
MGSIVSNGSNGAVITYNQTPAFPDTDLRVYAQHFNGLGIPQWTNTVGGILVDATASNRSDFGPLLAGDDNAGTVIVWDGNNTTTSDSDIFGQYISDTTGAACSNITSSGFCGTQVIADAILSFTSIPVSFTFPTVTSSGTAQSVFNNGAAASQPDSDDLLGVEDTRNSGGFEVQLQESTTFSNGTDEIPLSDLFAATSISSPVYTVPDTDAATSCPGTDCGVIYGTSVTTRGISAPADSGSADLDLAGTYTSAFGSGPIVLMGATLPAASGRGLDANMYQFINYRLTIPALQPAGNYAVVLTFTLVDDTTP